MDNNKNFTIRGNSPRFLDYLHKLKEITNFSPREINYQLELIKPFLDSVFSKNIQVIDTSNNGRDTNLHTREAYTTVYGAAPDLILTRGYQYENINLEEPIVYAAVEIKKPFSKENISGEIKDYNVHVIEEIATYLYKCDNIILTNCKRWQFFCMDKNSDKTLIFNFVDLLPILNIKNNYWYKSKGNNEKPSLEDRLNELKKCEKYEKLKSFFENEENPLLKQIWNYDVNSCIDSNKIKGLLNSLRSHLDNCIRKLLSKVLCNTIDLFPGELPQIGERNKEMSIKEPDEWSELVSYLSGFAINNYK